MIEINKKMYKIIFFHFFKLGEMFAEKQKLKNIFLQKKIIFVIAWVFSKGKLKVHA